MLTTVWSAIEGTNTVSEESDIVAAKRKDNVIMFGYLAYGDIKVIEISGIDDVCAKEDVHFDERDASVPDCEIVVPVQIGDNKLFLTVNDMDEITMFSKADLSGISSPIIESADQYECTDIDDFYGTYPEFEGLADILELA